MGAIAECERGLIPCPLFKRSSLQPGHTGAAGLPVPEWQLRDVPDV